MKNRISRFIFILASCLMLSSCGVTPQSEEIKSMNITNKEELQADWQIDGGHRFLTFTSDVAINRDEEFANGNLVVKALDSSILSIDRLKITPLKIGHTVVQLLYKTKVYDDVGIEIKEKEIIIKSLSISNKLELQCEWHVSEDHKEVLYTSNPLSLEHVSIRSTNPEIVSVNGFYISPIKEGTADIELLYRDFVYDKVKIVVSPEIPIPIPQNEKEITFYYVNDTHGAFIRQNTDTNYNEAGISYIGQYLINQKNKKPNNTFILSGGDMFQGGFESNMTEGAIMADAMNIIGFDAMTLGNHEFDWGEDKMQNVIESLNFPVLSSNTFINDGKFSNRPSYILPYQTFIKDGIKIGIIGADKENLGNSISGSISSNFVFPNPTSYIKEFSDKLRLEEKCDLIIASFHDGEFDNSLTSVSSKTGRKYVDGIFLAHDHIYQSGSLYQVPYLESGCNGRYIGSMNFVLNYNSDTKSYYVTSFSASNINAYYNTSVSNPEIDNLLVKYKDKIGDRNEVIAHLSKSYTKEEFAALAAKAMYYYVNEHQDDFGGEEIYFASHNVGGVRANVDEGDLTLGQFFTAFPFDNYLCIQSSTSSQISYMKSNSHYASYNPVTPKYKNNHTRAVTINYIAENQSYGYLSQDSYVKYETVTAKQVFYEYLKSGRE